MQNPPNNNIKGKCDADTGKKKKLIIELSLKGPG